MTLRNAWVEKVKNAVRKTVPLKAHLGRPYRIRRRLGVNGAVDRGGKLGDGNLFGQEVCTEKDIVGRVVRIKGKYGKTKRLTKGRLWRHLPLFIRKLVLKIYRICILLTDYED